MLDIKHLTNERKGFLSRLFAKRGSQNANIRKRLAEPPRKKLHLRILLPSIAVVLAAWPLYSLLVPSRASLSLPRRADAKPAAHEILKLSPLDRFQSLQ